VNKNIEYLPLTGKDYQTSNELNSSANNMHNRRPNVHLYITIQIYPKKNKKVQTS